MTDARIDPIDGRPAGAVDGPARGIRLPTRFGAAVAGAAGVVGLAAVLVLVGPSWVAADVVPVLVGGAGLCLGLVARRTAPGLAWVALILGSLVAAGVPIAFSRLADPKTIGVGAWAFAALRGSAAATLTVAIAALYATRPERRLMPRVTTLAAFLVGWLAFACVLVVVLVLGGAREDPAFTLVDVATLPTALVLHFALLLTALGAAADLRAAAGRAEMRSIRGRLAERGHEPPFGDRLRAVVRELIPGQADADAAAIEAERVSLAGDLHAVVLPALRRAIADAEAGLPIENLAERLRSVDLELERLMADRWPVVLDAFGLVAALEDLAERTEAASAVQVVLEIDGSAGRPRPEIERTAWRIALVAIDNGIRHAAASRITIHVAVAPDRVGLSIADDGRGFDPTDPVRPGARGLSDLGRRAVAVGGRVAIEAGQPTGTIVRFEWPA
ncbi:MAG TPA: ATP-binding protein [Candidatus Limnocylindrales bacterium]|nr:ATP-binding protein [Candidatus Limnocylindrales bacterium]